MARLIIISNRLPFTVRSLASSVDLQPSSGGLVTALGSYLERRRREDPGFECVWLGWPGASVEPELEEQVTEALALQGARPVFLCAEEMERFYHGFCNNTIWPLFHYFPTYVEYSADTWETFARVNRRFCEAALAMLEPGDTIWVHDYQLLLLPGMLREALGAATPIGFFLHIPFPSYELFRLLPTQWKHDLLHGMLGADLVGFHVPEYTRHFLECVAQTLQLDCDSGKVDVGAARRHTGTFPIGIDFQKFMNAAGGAEVARRQAEIEVGMHGRQAIFSVDRLDYTKGIVSRLNGFEEFLLRHPEWRGKVIFLLTVVPSRGEVPQYQSMKLELEQRVGQINGRLSTVDWVPIVYQYRSLDFTTLVALYKLSAVGLITPLRDGMNLVAKEYLACKPDGLGVLVLSEMAGAARQLPEAVLVNPNNSGEIAEALAWALSMPPEEQLVANRAMQQRLDAEDANHWAASFLGALAEARTPAAGAEERLPLVPAERLHASRDRPHRAVPFLGYDEARARLAARQNPGVPDPELLGILRELAEARRARQLAEPLAPLAAALGSGSRPPRAAAPA